jgi:hypothetical protein
VAHTCYSGGSPEIRKIMVQSQTGQIVHKTLCQKKTNSSQKRAGGVAQDVGLKFKPQYCKKKKGKNIYLYFIPFNNQLIFHCIDIPPFIYPFTH